MQKRAKDCKTIAEDWDLKVCEQLLNVLPRGPENWVSEGKPKTSTEAAYMTDSYYLQARKQDRDSGLSESRPQDSRSKKLWLKDPRNNDRRGRLPSIVQMKESRIRCFALTTSLIHLGKQSLPQPSKVCAVEPHWCSKNQDPP